ncbi:hypothetical protein ACFVUN_28825 [Kitasatospora griseola]|uniref:hypothetical protein n=1 Tax=Kitasatospora griseola TaxID=2064 RepID=UPI0036D9EDA8
MVGSGFGLGLGGTLLIVVSVAQLPAQVPGSPGVARFCSLAPSAASSCTVTL